MFPWTKIWWKSVPFKVSVFVWKAIQNRIPTKDNLRKRGILRSLDSILCSCCYCSVKSSNHLLLTCFMLANNVHEHFLEFIAPNMSGTKRKIMSLICQCTIWKICKLKNNIVFKESVCILDELINDIKINSWK